MRRVIRQKMKYTIMGIVITTAIGVAMVKRAMRPIGEEL